MIAVYLAIGFILGVFATVVMLGISGGNKDKEE